MHPSRKVERRPGPIWRPYTLVVSRAGNAILILDGEARLRWGNDAFTELSGYVLAEANGKTIAELLFGPSTSAESQHELISAIASP